MLTNNKNKEPGGGEGEEEETLPRIGASFCLPKEIISQRAGPIQAISNILPPFWASFYGRPPIVSMSFPSKIHKKSFVKMIQKIAFGILSLTAPPTDHPSSIISIKGSYFQGYRAC